MARIIILDSGPLGDACRRRDKPDVRRLTLWYIQATANGAIVAIPEIADYEVRRGLISKGATDGVERLDKLHAELGYYIPISTAAMRKSGRALGRRSEKGYWYGR